MFRLRVFAALLIFFVFGCGGAIGASGGTTTTAHPLPARDIRGQVTYKARHPTPTGTSAAIEVRPARRVNVWALAEDG